LSSGEKRAGCAEWVGDPSGACFCTRKKERGERRALAVLASARGRRTHRLRACRHAAAARTTHLHRVHLVARLVLVVHEVHGGASASAS
jgi:hypothetical protein